MAYKCLECGHIFEEGEQATWSESRGEFWGFPCSEEVDGCPLCKGDYEETTPCKICGSEHLEEDLNGGVCNECIDRYKNDFDMCLKVSENDKVPVKINALVAWLIDEGDIEQILIEYLKSRYSTIDCSEYIDDDRDDFGEKLAQEVKKNECKAKQQR